jgi:hypothetical protein
LTYKTYKNNKISVTFKVVHGLALCSLPPPPEITGLTWKIFLYRKQLGKKIIGTRVPKITVNLWSLSPSPWSRVLFDKLTVDQPVKKFLVLYRCPKFHYRVHNSWICQSQSTSPRPISLKYFSMLSSHLCRIFPTRLFLWGFPTNIFVCISHFTHAFCLSHPSHIPLFDQPNATWQYKLWKSQLSNFLCLPVTFSRKALEPTQPPIQWLPGALSLGVKRLGSEADHWPPSSAKVKKAWSYTSTPQYVFMVWCLVKHRDNFTFLPLSSPVTSVSGTNIAFRTFSKTSSIYVLPSDWRERISHTNITTGEISFAVFNIEPW